MLHFDSDYMEGAHPAVMRQLCETNLEQTVGYGSDEYTKVEANMFPAQAFIDRVSEYVFINPDTGLPYVDIKKSFSI